MGARRVEYMEALASHQQMKLYAIGKCVEIHLKIPDEVIEENCVYDIAAYHW